MITPDRISEVDEAVLTRRVMTSQVYGIYDLLGLLCPITIKYKLFLQKMSTGELG